MLYLTVHLYGRTGEAGEFRAYEAKALAVFRRHGGEVLVAYAPERKPGTEAPDEIQVLRIADKAGLDAFMRDPERAGMAAERDAVIKRTEVFTSETIIGY